MTTEDRGLPKVRINKNNWGRSSLPANQLPPEQTTAPNSPNDALFEFIRDRLWDSFDVGGEGHRFLGYSSPHYPNGDEGVIQAAA